MGLKPRIVYLDTNVFIDGVESFRPAAVILFKRVASGDIMGVTSELTLSELLVKPLELRRDDLALAYTRMLSVGGVIETVPVSMSILVKSAEIRARIGGRLPDAIHVATAIESGCDALISSDKRMPMLEPLARMELDDFERQNTQ